jgi:hypothetical protein
MEHGLIQPVVDKHNKAAPSDGKNPNVPSEATLLSNGTSLTSLKWSPKRLPPKTLKLRAEYVPDHRKIYRTLFMPGWRDEGHDSFPFVKMYRLWLEEVDRLTYRIRYDLRDGIPRLELHHGDQFNILWG